MIADILTVAGKELREIFTFGETRGRGKFSLLILIGVFGVFFPLQSGRDWVSSPMSIMVWGWMPFLWVSSIVADLFAGERERHTLEALLATRLSDQSILFGKLLAALTYGFSLTWIVLLSSIVTINIVYGKEGLLFYPVETTIGAFVFSILVSGLSGCIGVFGIPAREQCPPGSTDDERGYAGLVPAVHVDPVHPENLAGGGEQFPGEYSTRTDRDRIGSFPAGGRSDIDLRGETFVPAEQTDIGLISVETGAKPVLFIFQLIYDRIIDGSIQTTKRKIS